LQHESPYRDPTPPASGRSRRRRSAKRSSRPAARPIALTSHPTSRNAYLETRVWLLERHGPICAYCGVKFHARVMTLDHVTPRRGQTAYDRRDNLVLACPGCNAAKRDQAPLAFLLAVRSRAANLVRYGAHLSPMLVDLARSLAPDALPDDESPYRD
jgi:5-methylcytosine-specific restriction endonuclease McrA